MRFYEFYEGQILIDDRTFVIFHDRITGKDGLCITGRFHVLWRYCWKYPFTESTITDEQIKQAAEFVQADKFIHTLPNTYHAKVIERGASYSSGQRQLISFARTIVTDPKILVLDEATANIDTETEGLIQERISQNASKENDNCDCASPFDDS